MKKVAAALAFLMALSAQALAQGKGGKDEGGKGGKEGKDGDKSDNRISWYRTLESVADNTDTSEKRRKMKGFAGSDAADKKYILVYIRPLAEIREPGDFNNADMINLSQAEWSFVKMDFDKENAHIKAWGIKNAPAVIGCDIHGNDYLKAGAPSIDQLRRITGGVPEMVQRYEAKLKSDYARALDALKTDDARAVKLFVEIVANGKKGYKEVDESATRLGEFAESALKKADLPESVSPEAGIDYLDDLTRIFKGTATGVQAEIRIARLDHERGNVQPAILRLVAIQKYDPKLKAEIENAGRALEEISKAGDAKVERAASGDRALAKETLRKLSRDYAGTDAGRKAGEIARRLE